ncbi:defensin alpha-like protein 1 [Peromyscus californicus insignis]|uniref:defensin alpha-like protein 1 n=1 Tax=Peromyscus californicus insignis TaxID=564181 RepID=UPI0022A68C88|nr:defensin alpha-like protein 1 [Peromyscus californicus insignis]
MKTLVLLSALVLLAYLTQADPFPEATEETKNEDQPGVEDQNVSISFGGPEGSALQDAERISGSQNTCVLLQLSMESRNNKMTI